MGGLEKEGRVFFPSQKLTHLLPFSQSCLADRNSRSRLPHFVTGVSLTSGKSVMHYQPGGPRSFLKIELASPALVAGARSACEAGLSIDGLGSRSFLTYESHVLYALRYMVDAGMVGGAWCTLPAGKYAPGPPPGSRGPTTHCQVCVCVCV